MPGKNAVIFNGAASLIAQEAALLDLLIEPERGRLSLSQGNTLLAGLSSGALMTFIVNAAFSDKHPLSWPGFKEKYLFPLKTDQIYKFRWWPHVHLDTSPLRALMNEVNGGVGYRVLGDLPFDSAVLTASLDLMKTCWLNNATHDIPSGDSEIAEHLRKNASTLDVVDCLMCSTAIPLIFPRQRLRYRDGDDTVCIKTRSGKDAMFADGATFGLFHGFGVFHGFRDFFEAYGERFESVYFITPYFEKAWREAEQLEGVRFVSDFIHHAMALLTEWFIKALKAYDDEKGLAENIYICMPEIEKFDLLDFETQRRQYNCTKTWGCENPERIAVDIDEWPLG